MMLAEDITGVQEQISDMKLLVAALMTHGTVTVDPSLRGERTSCCHLSPGISWCECQHTKS